TAVSEAVYTSSPYLGAFLPYAPLQHLILRETGPLVMTSANISSLPIICDDSEMLRFLENNEKLSGVLLHNRNMLRRLDDSVAEVVLNKPHIIRRARGYVPKTIQIKPDKQSILAKPISILALGAQEKNTVCLYRDGYAYVSAEVGDLNNLETEAVFRDTIADMRELLRIKPDLAVCDLHPGYASVKYAEELGIPVLKVQHHHAHIASVMAEHGLTEPVIGIAFDGTGYGADGTVWGGEFLIASPEGFTRAGHIKPAAFLGSDESVKQGRISAACMLYDAGIGSPDDKTAIIYAALSRGINTVRSSSMGRVFDAVSSILDICHESEYSGQCAVELENAAAEYLPDGNGNPEPFPYDIKEEGGQAIIDLTPCIKEIYRLYNNGENKNALAWRFHITVCGFIVEVCEKIAKKTGVYRVALSGGVFQNRILTENTFPALQKAGFAVYRNVSVPAGDGGISLGQVYIGMNNA
ncbi:MAG: Sua5/YciO/YrdC/YwlC family protein, partial [Oscillospiraceae bacterium]|nr:Sua5/YciO/YrdC/YwlC family protein [Oscillospiraceae bacterium]